MKPELTLVQNSVAAAPVIAPQPAQGEMPFAVVEGQPITEMPRDLYIPPQALEVFLEAFEGPLDGGRIWTFSISRSRKSRVSTCAISN